MADKYGIVMEKFWTSLGADEQELLTTMLKDTDSYDFEDIV